MISAIVEISQRLPRHSQNVNDRVNFGFEHYFQ